MLLLGCNPKIARLDRSTPQERRRQIFRDDDSGCFWRQIATNQVQTGSRIEQQRSHVVRREQSLYNKLAHQGLENENVDFAVSKRRCLFDHRALPGRSVPSFDGWVEVLARKLLDIPVQLLKCSTQTVELIDEMENDVDALVVDSEV